ncbi:hypothetical protein EJB05_35702 [Eragrostis curvula]|uniref:Protein FAR1-RELATED SEQUENCE n=1 Tax=Eragrostis curvula TaxID=38414 RepID=A0A5J9U8Q4_9POAL|nr:hypothetical protein EJB05_35702 [Eragrostis curvula]
MDNTLFTSTPNGSFQSLLDVSANALPWGASQQSLAASEVINSSRSAPVSIVASPAYDADIGTDFEDSDDDVEFLQESPEKQASDPCCDGNSDQDEPEVEYDSETMETEDERDFEPPPELIIDTDTDDEDQYESPTESHNETSPEIQQLPVHSSGDTTITVGVDDLKFEIYSPPGLGDCGCVSSQPTINKRKRWPKGSTPPNCRKPRGMGSIEKAMRNAPNRTTEFIFEPVLGLVFDSTAEAFQFYNLYSWEIGFGIHLGSFSENRVNGRRTMQQLGFDSRCTKSSKRIGCKAMLRLHRTPDDGWYVSTHVSEHNHELAVSCGEKRELRSHSQIEQCTKDMVMYLRENNVTLSRVHCIMGSLFGSMEDIPFNQKTLRAVCKQIASDQRDEDVTKTLRLFRKWRQEDPGFQFAVDPDENNKIKTLIWVNGRSRSQWNYFGDVVTFDTTYCTNLYNMPFGMFVGVNNHFQSVLFAGVLMRDETAKSFKWVFNEFLILVGGKHPVTILTGGLNTCGVSGTFRSKHHKS